MSTRNTKKYLIIALWCTYETLSVAIVRIPSLILSPLTGLGWLCSRYPTEYLPKFAIYFYTAFIILGFFLGWLFFISEKIKSPRTRTITIGIFLSIVALISSFASFART